jgi:hypothetical protein
MANRLQKSRSDYIYKKFLLKHADKMPFYVLKIKAVTFKDNSIQLNITSGHEVSKIL